MIITINPVTIGRVTTDKAILNISVGDASVAISLYPAVEQDGVWVRVAGADVLPIVGVFPDLLDAIQPSVQALVAAVGV